MRASIRGIAAVAAVASLAACTETSSSPAPAPPQSIQGFFAGCRDESGPDTFDAFAVEGDRIRYRMYSGYTTADRTCGGTQELTTGYEGTVVLGADVLVPNLDPLAPTSLIARAVDVRLDGGATRYGLLYLAPGTPDVLFSGERSGARDGTTPALRPDRLAPYGRPRVVAPAAWPAILSGAFRACLTEGGADFNEVVSFDGAGGLAVRRYAFPTTDGTCAGDPSVAGGVDGAYALRPGADPVGAVTVVTGLAVSGAHALDVTLVGSAATHTIYTLGWVDALSAPEAFHLGDDEGKTRGGSELLRARRLQPLSRFRIATPAAPAYTTADLAGTYEKCRYDAGLDQDFRTRAVFSTDASNNFTVTSWSYASKNRTCAGGETVAEGPTTATYAFRTAAPTTGTSTMRDGTGDAFPVTTHLAEFGAPMNVTIGVYVDHLSGTRMLFFDKGGALDYIGAKVP